MAKWLIIAGVILIVFGILLYAAPRLFSWFGKLPGDIRIERENGKIFFPLTSMIIVSLMLTIVVNIIRYFFK